MNQMKRIMNQGRILIALVTAITVLLSCAFAGTSTEGSQSRYDGDAELSEQLNNLPPFKFEKHKDGIGYGVCPVYTAPSTESYRCAEGKAACDTNSKMDDAGYVSGWLLVRYETNSGNYRVGYIPPKYVRDYKSKMSPHFGYIPAVAEDTIR